MAQGPFRIIDMMTTSKARTGQEPSHVTFHGTVHITDDETGPVNENVKSIVLYGLLPNCPTIHAIAFGKSYKILFFI